MKLIHVIGGGFHQVALAQIAKAMGLRVLVTDMYENPPARAVADEFERIDTTNMEETLKCARRHKIDYVVTDMTDVAVPTAAYIAEALGLPGIGYETALRFTNKYVMRTALRGKLPEHIPESRYFERPEEAISYCRDARGGHDLVVKPINSQGSRGVFVLARGNPAPEQLVYAAFAESRERGILIERFVGGNEYSAETFVRDGKVHNLTLTKKYHYSQNPCIDERNTYLGDVAPELERDIFAVNEKIIGALGLPFGNTHAEYKVDKGRVYLMEIAARSAGGSIGSQIIPFLTGFNCLQALLNVLLDRPFTIAVDDYRKKFAILKFFNFAPGRVKKILINESMTKDLMVFTLTPYLEVGQYVKPIKDSRDRMGYFVVGGTDREEVLRREKQAESAVQLEYF